jgi:peptide/nickel transport system permease protein
MGIVYGLSVLLAVGVPIGLLAGFRSGVYDTIATRSADIVLAMPPIIIMLTILAILSNNMAAAMCGWGLLGAPIVMRVVRSAVLSVRGETFVDAARVSGLSTARILVRHIYPRVVGPVIVQAALLGSSALLAEASLAYLGLGVRLPNASWGGMVAEAGRVISQDGWLMIPPGAVIAATVLALCLLGDAARDASVGRWSSTPTLTPKHKGDAASKSVSPTDVAQAESDVVLSIRDLSVELVGPDRTVVPVVDDVSLTVRSGEIVGIVGESGSGKTMTMRAALRLLGRSAQVVSGSCELGGVDLLRLSNKQMATLRGRAVGFISQEAVNSLDPVYTIGSQLYEVVRRHQGIGRRAAHREVLRLLELVSLPDPAKVARSYPYELSGGMAQRVVIALALAGSPRLLVADEPTTALDVTIQAEILALLRDLRNKTGLAILLTTHNWGVVADICDRVVVMYAGQVFESGDVEALFSHPMNPYTEALLRANPEFVEDGQRLPDIPGAVPSPGSWPPGCHFSPRCAYSVKECVEGWVSLKDVDSTRRTRCIRYEQLYCACRPGEMSEEVDRAERLSLEGRE